ncbi:MFS transporter [Clostridium felsineum]|uniref:MFS transporter n=1 Tax=Clostridium felsineum TaxID=36839 RepID=UPI00098BF334|nr:MFS transporter [Clostridium felsineum]URZ18018.1 Protein TsgA [Clostridium felsineum DSM 794]
MNKNFRNMLIAFIGAFFLSLFSNTLSPFITTIKNTYGVSSTMIAVLPPTVYLASFAMSIIGAKLMAKLDLKKGLYFGFSFIIIASTIIIFAKSFYVLLIGYFFSGFAVGMGSLIATTIISLLPKQYQKFGLYNAFFGLGGILILPISKFFLKNGISFHYVYIIHIVTIIVFFLIATGLKDVSIHNQNSSENSHVSLSVLKNPLVLTMCLAIFFYVGAEISTTNWTGTFLEKYYSISKANVPNILLAFWILFTLGRAFGDKIIDKIGALRFLCISPIISILGIFIILSKSNSYFALVGVGIIGITISVIYPAIQGYIIQHVPSKDIPSASAVINIFNNCGATFLTYIIGFAAGIKITSVFIIQIIFYLYIILASAKYLKKTKTNKKAA